MSFKNFKYLLFLILFTSCDDVFEYHPYDVNISGEKHINGKNIQEIESNLKDKDTLRVAFVADTQGWLDQTRDFVKDVNKKGNADFVIHLGDITDYGNTKDFMWQRDILNKLDVPYVVIIGNHDVLGTGDEAFVEIFGEHNYSFIAGRTKFVCLNTNAIEYDYSTPVPDFDFMEEEIIKDKDQYDNTVMCMHAPPFNEQFNNNVVKSFERYVNAFKGILFCTAGHVHRYEAKDLYDDGLIYYCCDCVKHRNYMLFTITKDKYEYEIIYF